MAPRARRNLAITFAAAVFFAVAAAVIAGEVFGGHLGRRTVALMANAPVTAPALAPGHPANPAPLPLPLPHRPG